MNFEGEKSIFGERKIGQTVRYEHERSKWSLLRRDEKNERFCINNIFNER